MPDKDTIKPQPSQNTPKPPKVKFTQEGGQGTEGDGDSGQTGIIGKK